MFSFELGASFEIHPAAQAAYDVFLAIGPPIPSGPCLWVSRPETDGTPRLAVTALRRRLRLRRERFETPPEVDVFKDVLRAMGVR